MGYATQDISGEVNAALHALLDQTLTLDGRDVPHYDDVPPGADMPVYGTGRIRVDGQEQRNDADAYQGYHVVNVQIDGWSAYRGKKEAQQLADHALGAVTSGLDDTLPPSLSVTEQDFADYDIIREPGDGADLRHLILPAAFRIQLL